MVVVLWKNSTEIIIYVDCGLWHSDTTSFRVLSQITWKNWFISMHLLAFNFRINHRDCILRRKARASFCWYVWIRQPDGAPVGADSSARADCSLRRWFYGRGKDSFCVMWIHCFLLGTNDSPDKWFQWNSRDLTNWRQAPFQAFEWTPQSKCSKRTPTEREEKILHEFKTN